MPDSPKQWERDSAWWFFVVALRETEIGIQKEKEKNCIYYTSRHRYVID